MKGRIVIDRSVTLMDKAMFNNIPDLVCDIVDHPKFNPSYTDGMNEPFCFGLIYAITGLTLNGRGSEDEKTIDTYNKILKNLILKHSPICIGKNIIDFTLIHICAIFPFMNEILNGRRPGLNCMRSMISSDQATVQWALAMRSMCA